MRSRSRSALLASLLIAVALLPAAGLASSYTIVPGGPSVNVATTAADENINVTFSGTAGKRISVRLSNVKYGTSTCCSTKVSVLKPDGTTLIAATYVGTSGGFLDTKTLPVSGTYRIFIDPQGSITGSMTVTLYDVPADAVVATTPGGAPVSVSTTVPGQNAKATFPGAAGQRVSLKMTNVTIGTSTTASTKVSLLKPDGTTLVAPLFVGTRGGYLEATLPTPGTYTVFIDPQSFATGSMTLTLYDVPADVLTTITPGGAPVTVTTVVPGQNAKATFSGTAGQRVSLKVAISLNTSADTAKVSMTKPDGTTLVSATTITSTGGFIDVKVLPLTGTYTILADPQGAATGSITLTLYDVPADVVATISFGTSATVTTTTPGQNAKVTFTGTAGQRAAVRFGSVTIGTSTTGSVKGSLLKPDGTTLKSLTFGTSGGALDATLLPVSGTYTILVDPQSFATGSATLTLYDVPPDVTGTITPDGSPVTVTIVAPYQNGRMTFAGTAGQKISLKMKFVATSCCTANVSILKPDGSLFVSPIGVGATENFMDAKTLPVTGTYTIVVDPVSTATGTMTLTLYSIPGDVTATITPGGPPVTVTTTAAGQNARLTFSGTAGDGIVLTIGPTCCATTVSILKPDGTTLVSKSFGTAGGKVYALLTVTGTYTIVVDYQAGALGSVTLQLSVDNTPPTAPVLSLSEVSGDSHAVGPAFYYRPAGAGAGMTVLATTSDAGAGIQKVAFPGLSGGFTPTSTLSDTTAPYSRVYNWVTGATYSNAAITVTAYDNVGNTSSATFSVTPDSSAPTTTDNTAMLGSAWKNTNQTVTLTPLDGAGSGVATTRYTTNGSTPTNSSPQGTTVNLTADGIYTIKYFSVDNVSNNEAVKTAGTQIRIDKTPPTSVTLNSLPASIKNGQALSGSAVDGGPSGIASISYYYCAGASCTPSVLIGTSSTSPSYTFAWNSQPADGVYQVLARATDAAGNTLDSAKQTVTVDNTLPDTTITAAPASPSTGSVSFSFNSSQPGSTFQCELDTGGYSACTSPKPYTGLTSGSHTFRVRAIDPAGNVDATPATHTWTVDAVAPNTTITSNPPALTNSASATFDFTSTEPGSTFECQLDAGGFAGCTGPQPYNGLADGSHTFSVRATDPAGNVDASPATFTWTVDTGAPDTTITAAPSDPSNDTSPSFSFTASEPGSSFACELDGGGFSACTSAQGYSGLADGSHTFSVRATDAAGNVDASPATFTWTVDTAAPDTTISDAPSDPSISAAADFSFLATEPGSTFECRLDAGSFAACTSAKSYTGLADGSHTFSVRATDPAGNVDSSQATFTWTIDATAPNTTITESPSNPASSTAASFSFTASEPGSTFECQLDGGGFSACTSAQGYSGLAPGSHTFSVRATDAAGNTDASPATFTWTIDTSAPDTTITDAPSDPSNDSSPSFSFTATESGSSLACQLDGGGFSPCTSPQPYSGLADGSHTFSVRATDPAGNPDASPATFTWTVDTAAPDTTITDAPSDPSNDTSPSFSFSASESGSAFECQLDGDGFSPCTSAESYSGLAPGSHTFSVRATDAAGNTDASAATHTWTVDTAAPDTTITAAPSDPSNDTSPSFSFSASESGSSFECQLDGGGFSACTSAQGYSGLAEGSHTFGVRATDPAGNPGTAASHTWTIDITAPGTTITDAPSNPSNDTSPSFSFTASESGSTFECQLDGGGFSACTSAQGYSGLADGPHTFSVRATDAAGNTDASAAAHAWTIDASAPDTTITDAPSDPSNDTSPSFSFTASESGSTFECQLDGGGFSACTSPQPYSALAPGSHTFWVRATDPIGNMDVSSATYTWTVDTAAPNTTITDAPGDPSNDTSPSFSFTASEGGSSFECELDGGGYSACTSAQGYSGLADGPHAFSVRATDAAGNTDASAAAHTWTIDASAPTTTITDSPSNPTSSTAASFSFTASEGGSSFECQLDGSGFSACTSAQGYSGLAEGSHTFAVRATDPAGNTGTAASHTWTIDTTAPATTITDAPTDPSNDTSPSFSFTASEGGSSFECQLDGGGFSACTSGQGYTGLATGSHTFEVRATDAAGNVEAAPASFTWTIL